MIGERILIRLVDRLALALASPSIVLRAWIIDGVSVGALDDARAQSLARFRDVFTVDARTVRFKPALDSEVLRTAALDEVVRALAAEGKLTKWRNERYAVGPRLDSAPLALIERAAARFFGIETHAAHVNGTASPNGATRMWIARRSAAKSIDPGQLDNLVGGGIAAGAGIADTLVKEAWEEAGIAAELARSAQPVGALRICRSQPDGLQRETIYAHDLPLPSAFVPTNQDGEVAGFRLASPEDAAVLAGNVAGEDIVTAEASLVIADWLLRHGRVSLSTELHARLDRLRQGQAPA